MKNTPKTPSTSAPRTSNPTMNRARLTGPVVGLTLLTLGLVACGGSTPTMSAPSAGVSGSGAGLNPDIARVPYIYDGKDHSWKEAGTTLSTQALMSGNNDLSAQDWSSATNGWGPVEKNSSNGESGAGDGNTLTLKGKTYTTGLGVHAVSDITYNLNGQCSGFQSDVGIDDEVRSLGSVTFEIWADGTKLYDSGLMTGNSAAKFASADLTGKNQLRLVVTNGGDNINYDHADWAGATLLGCSGSNTTWTTVASENGSFTLQARSTMRYGTGQSWTQKDLDAGTYSCSNDTFGTDPAYGVGKQCQVSSAGATAAPSNASSAYSGPLVITKGGTYSGNWESQDPNVPVISVQTSEPVIIENSNLRGKGNIIAAVRGRLTVRNINAVGLNPNVAGRAQGHFMNVNEMYNLYVDNNSVQGTLGIYMRQYVGNPSQGDTIRITKNKFKNIDGRPSDGNGGFRAGYSDQHPHMLQFNAVQKVPNVDISWNEIINEPGNSLVEENINFYESSGTPSSPMMVHDNYVQGAYNANPFTDSGYAGGGILLGDGTVTDPSLMGYIYAFNNHIVNTTNEAMAITGGVGNKVYGNRVISSGLSPDGRRILAQNVGIYIWDINGLGILSPATFSNNSVYDNYSAWTKVNADSTSWNNPYWLNECGKFNTYCANNVSGGQATQAMVAEEYQIWLRKVASNNLRIGPSN